MKYYFCEDIPYKNTSISKYDTLEELIKEEKEIIKRYKDWYIIKGEEIEI